MSQSMLVLRRVSPEAEVAAKMSENGEDLRSHCVSMAGRNITRRT